MSSDLLSLNNPNDLKEAVYFVSGIDTDAGKTIVTGWIAREMLRGSLNPRRVATFKPVQTGAADCSPDIEMHRKLMGRNLPEDSMGLTTGQLFSYPASPHLAARLDGKVVDLAQIENHLDQLKHRYQTVLVEGAGGLMVPLTETLLTIDYVAQKQWPVIFVCSGKLGSLNHALLSLEALARRGMSLAAFAWNDWKAVAPDVIRTDTHDYLMHFVKTHFPDALWLECPDMKI